MPVTFTTEQRDRQTVLTDVTEIVDELSSRIPYDLVNIPDGTRVIGKNAFKNCTGTMYIFVPRSVAHVEEGAFNAEMCRKTVRFTFYHAGDDVILHKAFLSDDTDAVEIPAFVTIIADYAFCGCKHLKTVTMHNGITRIGASAFACCYKLESITLPDTLTYLGRSAFNECPALREINIPPLLRTINEGTFEDSGITAITIPPTIEEIGRYAFCDSRLSKLGIQNGLKRIGEHAFTHCSYLESTVLPDSVEMVAINAFETQHMQNPVRMSCLVVPDALINNSFGLKPEIPVYKSSEIGPLLDPNRRIADIERELKRDTTHTRIKIEHVWELRTPILKRIFAAYTHSVKSFARSYINLAVTCRQINIYFNHILHFCFHPLPQDLLSEFGITLPNNDDFEHPGIDKYHYTGTQYFFKLVLRNQRPPQMLRRPQIAELCRHHDNTTGYLNADNQPTGSAVAEPPQKRVRLSPT